MIDQKPLVSVVIITYNRANKIGRALESVKKQDLQPLEVIVVDNASTDNTREVVESTYPDAKYIKLHKNTGVCLSRNVGIVNASAEYIYLLDDDGWLETDAISKSLSVILDRPEIGAVESKLIDMKDNEPVHIYKGNLNEIAYIPHFVECCSLLRKDAVVKAGYFDDDLFYGAEGEELSLRMLYNGYKCCYQPESIMYHEIRNTQTQHSWSKPLKLRNSNRIALWLWPQPQRTLRLIRNFLHSLRMSVTFRQPSLPFLTAFYALADAMTVKTKRSKLIDTALFKWYRKL